MILEKNFSNLKVILVEPNGPLNVGSVARLCSNFEVDELRIVSPKCDIFSIDAKKMASTIDVSKTEPENNKTSDKKNKTVAEIDREKLEKKFSKSSKKEDKNLN